MHGLAITASGCLPPLHNGAPPAPAAVQHAPVPSLPSWADALGHAATAPAHGPVWRDTRLALAPAELTLVQCAASPDYWLLFGVLGAGTGCGLLFSNNLGARRCTAEAEFDCIVEMLQVEQPGCVAVQGGGRLELHR